jgi:integrase
MGVTLSEDTEIRPGRPKPYRARVRWVDPASGERKSKSESFEDEVKAEAWFEAMRRAARGGVDPTMATMTLADYGATVMPLAVRGLEIKTLDPYMAGWKLRVVPSLGHIPVRLITNGAADRAVHGWIADECGRSTIRNSIAIMVRVMDQAVRDGLIERNTCRVTGWQSEFKLAEDELDDPRSLALPDWDALDSLADALVDRSRDHFAGWGKVVRFAACTATRIGEVSGVRVKDIDTTMWTWDLCRQTTPGPNGLIDKGTKGKRRRKVPIILEIREMVQERLTVIGDKPMERLFTGPRGGPISTAVLRRATHWDEVVAKQGYEKLRRHDLRHTGLTWMADAGVPIHVLQLIAGHAEITTTQRYLHPSVRSVSVAGESLSAYILASRSPDGPASPIAPIMA